MAPSPSVIILVLDGARPDTLEDAMRDGTLPALERIRREGALHTVTTVFPSVTGPAYVPFLLGRYPGSVGLPGLRWYDRSRSVCRWPGYARSYVGAGLRHVDRDLDAGARTLFELAGDGVGALSVIGRGLSETGRVGYGALFAARTAAVHFRGDVRGWLAIDRAVSEAVVRRVHADRPAFTFAAFTGVDKASHAAGHGAPVVREAMRVVDTTAGRIREDAERGGYWASLHLWVVSDHGHSPVARHDDLDATLRAGGYRVLAHPWAFRRRPDVALMVSGNAMAHLYVTPDDKVRRFWPAPPGRGKREASYGPGARPPSSTSGVGPPGVIPDRWNALVDALLERPSVDLVLLPRSPTACEIRAPGRGTASLTWAAHRYEYHPETGDPLGLGTLDAVDADAAYEATLTSDYPDALVQIASLCASSRSGDVILSAARGWDFRARYEPIAHVSSHGALHREHMLVPLLTNHSTAGRPRRTVDVMPSAARVLGIDPGDVSGTPFVTP